MSSDPMPEEEQRALENLRKIKEVDSHLSIYQPLLMKMGFDYIVYLHGTSERGKDFVFIETDKFGDSILTACQIKAEKITGKATSDYSASGIINQMQQCLDYQVLNPVTHKKELPQSVILFTLYPFPDAALADMGIRLEQIKRSCKIIGPEKVVRLIKDFLPDVYAELAYPGEGIGQAMLRYVRIYRELAAFEVSSGHELTSFYVNLGFSQEGGGVAEVTTGLYSIARHGSSLNCSKSTFITIDTLAKVITSRLDASGFFSAINTSRPTVVRSDSDIVDSRLTPEEIEEDKKQLALSKLAGNKDNIRSDLADSLVVKIGDFQGILQRLQDLQKQYKDSQEKTLLFKSYVLALHCLDSFLNFMKARFSTDWIQKIPAADEKLPIIHFQLEEFDPVLLLELDEPIALVGEAGAGKTSLSRILTERAVSKKINGRKSVSIHFWVRKSVSIHFFAGIGLPGEEIGVNSFFRWHRPPGPGSVRAWVRKSVSIHFFAGIGLPAPVASGHGTSLATECRWPDLSCPQPGQQP